MSFLKPARPVYLVGPSDYLPTRRVTNSDLVEWMGAGRDSWIEKRTGIQERRWVSENEACSDLAVAAANELLKERKISLAQVKQIVLATISGDFPTPPTSPLIQHRLGLESVGAFDLTAACAGFCTGLHASAALALATDEDQLLLSAEVRSKFLSKEDFATAVLFGDGASASLVTTQHEEADFELMASQLFSDGSVATVISIEAGGSKLPQNKNTDPDKNFIHMKDSAALFLKAAEGMAQAATAFLSRLGIPLSEIKIMVPHQANLLLMRDIARRLNLPSEKIFETIQKTGNTSGASVGIALSQLRKSGSLRKEDLILLLSAGGGGLAACTLLKATRSQ